MKLLLAGLATAAMMMAAGGQAAKEAAPKKAAAKSAPKEAAPKAQKLSDASKPTAIPAEAVQDATGDYRYTDAQGKKWIYRKTPFGVTRMEDTPERAAAQANAAARWRHHGVRRGRQGAFRAQGPLRCVEVGKEEVRAGRVGEGRAESFAG